MRLRPEFHLVMSIGTHALVLLGIGWFASTGSPPLTAGDGLALVEIALDEAPPLAPVRPTQDIGSVGIDQQSLPPAVPVRMGGRAPSQVAPHLSLGGGGATGTGPELLGQDGLGNGPPDQAEGGPADPQQQARGPVDLGLGPGAFWHGGHGADKPPSTAPRPMSTTGGLAEAIRDHDVAIGLGAGGPVVTAARNVALSSVALGSATMVVTSDATGRVVSVQLAGATFDRERWTDVAKALLVALGSTRLKVPSGAQGVVVSLHIDASNRLPSGALGGPNLTGVGPLSVSGEFDLSDIGQKPKRVIRTRVLQERTI